MSTPRRAFNTEVVRPLEARVVLSAVASMVSVAVEQAIDNGPPMHPALIVTDGGSSQAEVISVGRSDQHGQLAFSAHDVDLTVPIDASFPVTVKTNDQRGKEIELIYRNESNTTVASATIVDKLGPGMTYIPDSSHASPGSQLTISTSDDGTQVVQLNLPDGISPRGEGYVEFQVAYPRK